MKINMLLTGNELMNGDTVDTNSAYIAQSLKDLNLTPYIKKVVGDDLNLLATSINELTAQSDVLIVNGGLGPTVDDLTAEALALATERNLVQHPEALDKLQQWSQRRKYKLTKANLKQTYLPEQCHIIANPFGSAVGFFCRYQECLVICTPGVPSELKPMVEDHILGLIKSHFSITETTEITRLRSFGITESGLQELIDEAFPDWPDQVQLGFRVQMPILEIKVTTVGADNNALNQIWSQCLKDKLADYIIGEDNASLPQALNQLLVTQGKKITTAESCTGGRIASQITSEPGSSALFEAGFVTYSNHIKQQQLGVRAATLEKYGAVSQQVVEEMAAGALAASGADLALAVSGIAGPDGGSEDKPVGTVWIAWGSAGHINARQYLFPISRSYFQNIVTAVAMDIMRRELLALPTDVDYFRELRK